MRDFADFVPHAQEAPAVRTYVDDLAESPGWARLSIQLAVMAGEAGVGAAAMAQKHGFAPGAVSAIVLGGMPPSVVVPMLLFGRPEEGPYVTVDRCRVRHYEAGAKIS